MCNVTHYKVNRTTLQKSWKTKKKTPIKPTI